MFEKAKAVNQPKVKKMKTKMGQQDEKDYGPVDIDEAIRYA
jgi:hypothetical protein